MEHGSDHDTPDMVIQQCITDSHDMAKDVPYDEWLLSDEDTDFEEDIYISEPESTPEEHPEGDSVDPPDEREWWSNQRRWF